MDQIYLKVADQKSCKECGTKFGILRDGRVWDLDWKVIKKGDLQNSGSISFWDLINPIIKCHAQKRFEDGHYADAVEASFKEINKQIKEIVKKKTGIEYDGTDLMFKAFSVDNPIIELGDLSTESGRDIQKGYSFIFAGSMMGIRNPKAHENLKISKEQAIHMIFLASLLMNRLE